MSDILRAIILGIVQGLTEFLPVSSSGHLEIMNELLGSGTTIDSDLTMVVLVHLGTAFSILYVFRQDIWDIITGLLRFQWDESSQLAAKIILSMLPAMVIGLLFEEQLEALFSGTIMWVGIFLCFTALVLYLTPSGVNSEKSVNYKDAGLIGIAQAVAILPGVSRSGMTIASALALGVNKAKAARFSFLMVLPIIIGKVILDVASGDLVIASSNVGPIMAALISSFLVGVWACKWMIALVRKSQLKYFAYYCAIVGILTIIYAIYG